MLAAQTPCTQHSASAVTSPCVLHFHFHRYEEQLSYSGMLKASNPFFIQRPTPYIPTLLLLSAVLISKSILESGSTKGSSGKPSTALSFIRHPGFLICGCYFFTLLSQDGPRGSQPCGGAAAGGAKC